jgi:hypothetical protein
MWLENCEVDLHYHLRRVQVPSPDGRRELDDIIARIVSTPLDRSRPPWEFHFVEGMANDRFAVVCKLHHALADGMASGNLLARGWIPRVRFPTSGIHSLRTLRRRRVSCCARRAATTCTRPASFPH